MNKYIDRIEHLKKFTDMYLLNRKFTSLVAYIDGMNLVYEGILLEGFREWLIVNNNFGNNLCWSLIILKSQFPEKSLEEIDNDKDANLILIRKTFDMLLEFLKYRDSEGLENVFSVYEKWLSQQQWNN